MLEMESLLQTDLWGRFKESFGWRAGRYGGFLGLERSLPFGKSLLYFPEVPFTKALIRTKRRPSVPQESGRIFVRLDILAPWTPEKARALLNEGWIKAFEEVQPEYRQWVDLTGGEAAMLAAMKPKGRYNIRLAQKHGLKVETGLTADSIQVLFTLYNATAKRTNFSGRSQAYFESLGTILKDNNCGEIILVKKGDRPLAGALLSFYGGVCSYLYGGSSNEHRELMAPYLAHFEAMKLAQKRGCGLYDLLAIAPPGMSGHPYQGLTRFKTQFGGESVRLLGSWDLVHDKFWYTIYRIIESRRRH